MRVACVRLLANLISILVPTVLTIGGQGFAQTVKGSPGDFVLDIHHPYVYLQFDHMGRRVPMQPGEGGQTIWIGVVNNCKMSILFPTFGKLNGDEGDTVPDRVIENEPMFEITTSSVNPETTNEPYLNPTIDKEAVHLEKGQAHREAVQKLEPRAENSEKIPTGYEYVFLGETARRIPSGQSLLVGIPVEHVGKNWFARLEFALDLGNYWNQPGRI